MSTEPPTEREQTPAQVSVSKPASVAQEGEQIKDPTPTKDTARSLHAAGEPGRLTPSERAAIVDALLAEHGESLTEAMVAEATGAPRSTAGRDLRAAKARAAERASA